MRDDGESVGSGGASESPEKGNGRKRRRLAVPAAREGLRSAPVQDPYGDGVGEEGGAAAGGVGGEEDGGVGGDEGGSDE